MKAVVFSRRFLIAAAVISVVGCRPGQDASSPIEHDVEDLHPGQSRRIGLAFRVVEPGLRDFTAEITGSVGTADSRRAVGATADKQLLANAQPAL